MYATFEADIENGRIKHAQVTELPALAHVLITLISPSSLPVSHKPDWEMIKAQIGKVKLRQDTAQWQRTLRSEWR